MAKYFNFGNDANRRSATLVVKMNTTAQRLYEVSRGYSLEALERLAGKWVLLVYDANTDRYTIDTEQMAFVYGRAYASDAFTSGSFNRNALANISGLQSATGRSPTRHYFCTACEQVCSNQHRCGEVFCPSCGRPITTKAEKERGLCEACMRRQISGIYGYHGRPNRSRPTFEKPHLRDSYAHLGVELEIPANTSRMRDHWSEIDAVLNPDTFSAVWRYENDSSIGSGVECIPEPLTLKGWNAHRESIDEAYNLAKSYGARFGRSNGLHVHIDRAYFGEPGSEEMARGVLLVSYMVYRFYEFFKAISGRECDCFGYTRGKEVKGLLTTAEANRYPDHFDAVNLAGANTIEVRVFGGHIDTADKFLAVVDIVNALARWAKSAGLGQAETMTPAHLVRYINNPERVLAFVSNPNANAYTSREAEAIKADFIAALNKKIGG